MAESRPIDYSVRPSMFTGLIEDIGTIQSLQSGAMTDLWIESRLDAKEPYVLGESISVDGACLTVVEFASGRFKVQAAPETLRRTTLGSYRVGTKVNLERAMQLGERLGGHIVSGHVDAISTITQVTTEGGSRVMTFDLPEALAPFFIEKGSVTIDGISLTVNQVDAKSFCVQLIPETQERTTLSKRGVGAKVNLEADLIGKYVARQIGLRKGGLSEETLRAAGFGK